MHDRLGKHVHCGYPENLRINGEKMNRMGLSLQYLVQCADEGEYMLNRTVTGDESWVHHYQPELNRATVQ
jgi:hypothetical protein